MLQSCLQQGSRGLYWF